jgi:DNA-directed RNA polymerase specialized sigma24 family protein
MDTMDETLLHLVDQRGQTLPTTVRQAVEAAHRWIRREYPRLDEAVVAGWAEDVGMAMGSRVIEVEALQRYAFVALRGKAMAWFRSKASREILVGIGSELEEWIGIDQSSQRTMYQTALFAELQSMLKDRDREILVLLQQGITSPANVGTALGLKYDAAAKAIQRTKERLRAIVAHQSTGLYRPDSHKPENGG